jgi:hypothetical protein
VHFLSVHNKCRGTEKNALQGTYFFYFPVFF